MHAYLLIGQNSNFKHKIKDLAEELKAKALPHPFAKIEDVRNLNSFIKLAASERTLIVIENIHNATIESLNAFLKNLEEPQENVFFALTAPSERKVLKTIVSRCQIVRVPNVIKEPDNKDLEQFFNYSIGQKLNYIGKISDRPKAIKFVEDLILFLHKKIHSDNTDYSRLSKDVESSIQTLSNLKINGNLNLQLTNLVINLL